MRSIIRNRISLEESFITTDPKTPVHLKVSEEPVEDEGYRERSNQLRGRAANLAVLVAGCLTVIKFIAAFLSGSVAVLSDAIHSLLDLVSAGISFFTVREAGKPADQDHPFGHGKIETISSLFEAILLVGAAVFILVEGISRFKDPQPLEHEWVAIITIAVSMIASLGVFIHNKRAAQLTESSAIQVNAFHFLSDVMSSAAILLGLIILKLTGWLVMDALLAMVVAVYILWITWKQVWRAVAELADVKLPEEEVRQIQEVLHLSRSGVRGIHDLRTRKSGASRHIDFHLEVCGDLSVHESHKICDEIENSIDQIFPLASVNIHVEPCGNHGDTCREVCVAFGAKRK